MIGLTSRARRRGNKPDPARRDQIEHELSASGGKANEAYAPPSRRHRRSLTTWQDEAAIQALREIGAVHRRTMQALIAEGINHVLAKYGKPPLADEN
jgi:antitoxin-like ribbon-helix-helix protein